MGGSDLGPGTRSNAGHQIHGQQCLRVNIDTSSNNITGCHNKNIFIVTIKFISVTHDSVPSDNINCGGDMIAGPGLMTSVLTQH